MLVILCFSLTCLLTSALGQGTNHYQEGWHEAVGFKIAAEIKKREDNAITPEAAIVGGVIAPTYAHPYLVGLLVDIQGRPMPSACGGTLVSQNRILTAAHCWFDGRSMAWRITAVLGSPFLFHGGLRIQPTKIAMHPRYNPATFANDIAMLYTPTIRLSHSIRPINLPHERLMKMDMTGHWGKASGFGRYSDMSRPTTNTMARHVWLRMISLETCRGYYHDVVLDSNICTSGHGGVGICTGDSGGPLTVTQTDGKTFLIGVSSFVARDGCELGFPSVFARVSYYMNWIRSQM